MKSFQDIISTLQDFWASRGCAVLQPYDLEVGAGTFHPATTLHCLTNNPWNVVYVQPSRRPSDSRIQKGAETQTHPNRLQRYFQLQVILKPSPDNIQEMYLESLKSIGLDFKKNDVRFVEDDWESPTLGASGLGWEVWLNGMEISQFTYMQQIGGLAISPVAGELTYGLERIAIHLQNVESAQDIIWNDAPAGRVLYSDISKIAEVEFCLYNSSHSNSARLEEDFNFCKKEARRLLELDLVVPAYEYCIKSSHIFNMLDARAVISVSARESIISDIRDIAKMCCKAWSEKFTKIQMQK